ncbi:MAG: DHH family phosphoesterase [Bacilli bacterium]
MDDIFKCLTESIKEHNQIILMAHQNIDLDAIGSLLCLYKIIESFDKKVYIVINRKTNESVKKAKLKLEQNNIKINYIYNKNKVLENDLLIILDTHKEEIIESNEILKKVKDKIVIDHHIKATNNIKDTIMSYINSNLSSTVEIITEYLKYLNKQINPIIATIMLAGIEIDTNNFNIKTTERTHETAAQLLKLGADNLIKKELLQENKEEYLKRQELIKNAFMINKTMALCLFDEDIYKQEDLSIIANELLQFDNVEVGFAIGKVSKNAIGISAKSLGNIDVEQIMKKLGGGGHSSNAASKIENSSIKEIKEQLLEILK